MVSEKDFDEILKKKGLHEQCRQIWWRHWDKYQFKFGGSRELLESIVDAAIKNGCKAPCVL